MLILGLGLILACRSWSQIRVSGLGCDSFGVDILCVSSSMFWTSLFDKFKLVCIFSSMCWTYWIFVRPCVGHWIFTRPWVGHIEYLLVHGLDVLKSFLIVQGFYLVLYLDECALLWKAYRRFCCPENFLVHGLSPSILFLLTGGFEQKFKQE